MPTEGVNCTIITLSTTATDNATAVNSSELQRQTALYDALVEAGKDVGRTRRENSVTEFMHDTPEKVQRAMDLFSCAARLDPTRATAWMWRGVMLSEIPQEDRALHNFWHALRLDPEDAFNYYYPILYLCVRQSACCVCA